MVFWILPSLCHYFAHFVHSPLSFLRICLFKSRYELRHQGHTFFLTFLAEGLVGEVMALSFFLDTQDRGNLFHAHSSRTSCVISFEVFYQNTNPFSPLMPMKPPNVFLHAEPPVWSKESAMATLLSAPGVMASLSQNSYRHKVDRISHIRNSKFLLYHPIR